MERVVTATEWKQFGDDCLTRRELRRALACWRKAERAGMPAEQFVAERWMAWMLLGDFERAWRQSDLAAKMRRRSEEDYTCWDGLPFDGRDLLVRCCHGLGDTIQFSRYLPILRERCRSLTFQVQRGLMPLYEKIDCIDRMVPAWEILPEEIEALPQIEIMELPYAFRTMVETVPNRVPYLAAQAASIPAANGTRLKVGVIWASSQWRAERSLPLGLFEPLSKIPGVALYSLQYGPEREDLRGCGFPITDLVVGGNDSIASTASFIKALDVLIAPDTMAVHLAGALGKPVWVLLLHAANWRWITGRNDSPWYPTMRLFWQPLPGDWETPIKQIEELLR